MNVTSRLKYEAAGVTLVVVAAIAAVIGTALLPWVSAGWVFVGLVVAAVWSPGLLDRGIRNPSPDHETTDRSADDGVLDVDLVNWANDRVGTRCLRCESDITYTPLGATDGRSKHRIECGCTLIHTAPKE